METSARQSLLCPHPLFLLSFFLLAEWIWGVPLSVFQLSQPGAGPAEAGTFILVNSTLNSLGLSWIKGLDVAEEEGGTSVIAV